MNLAGLTESTVEAVTPMTESLLVDGGQSKKNNAPPPPGGSNPNKGKNLIDSQAVPNRASVWWYGGCSLPTETPTVRGSQERDQMLISRGWRHQIGASVRAARRWLAVATVALAATLGATAGTIDVRWDAVSDPDLAGYRVYYGPTLGSHANVKDVGKTTSTQLTSLTDCTLWYVSVRAYDTGGLESTTDSNSVKGYARPVVSTVSPTTIKPGETLTFTVTGSNYDAGVSGDASRPRATVTLSNPNLTVTSYSVNACGTISMTVQAASSAPNGFSDVTVKNPDLSTTTPASKPWVFGTKASAIEIKASTDTTPPTVSSTNPAAGATGVVASVRPTVTFSESMSASSITTSTVRLIDVASGSAVAQSSGSPSLAGAVATITPGVALGAGKQYRIEVSGGTSGAKDLAGNALAQNYTQSPPFTIASDGGSGGPIDVTSFNPAAGQTGVAITTTQARITFNLDVSPLWTILDRTELQRRFRVLTGETFLPHQSTSPSYENGGRTVVITFAKPLTAGQTYVTQANLSGASLKRTLDSAGHSELYGGRIWRTSPGWTVEASIETTTFRSPTSGDSGTLQAGSTSQPDSSGGVPLDAEFRIKFQTTLSSPSVNLSTVKLFKLGSPLKQVPLNGYPSIENGDTVYVKPASPLEPGKKYRLWVKSGAQGVLLITANGSASSKGKAQPINFTTEVTATAQSETLSIGVEPPQTSQQQGGQQ